MSVIPLRPGDDAENHKSIKNKVINGSTFSAKVDGQKFEVVRLVTPDDADLAGIGAKWGRLRVGIQLLGAFATRSAAEKYVDYCVKNVEDWTDYFIVEKYEWLELPPSDLSDSSKPETLEGKTSQPILDEFMVAAQKKSDADTEMMRLRLDMAHKGVDGVTDIMGEMDSKSLKQRRLEQLNDIINNPDNYPEMLVNEARAKRDELEAQQ